MSAIWSSLTRRLGLTPADAGPFAWTLIAVLLLLCARIVILWTTPLELGPDEAQYWTWGNAPAFGYFSKPPMIAWVIGLTSSLCGDTEPCVRLSAPLFHSATALVIFFLGRALYGSIPGMMASIAYATLPGVALSSILITTDVPLLFFWSLALLATVQLLERYSLGWGLVWGVSVGLGLMSKYAMAYVFIGILLAILLTGERKRRLLQSDWLAGFGIAIAILLPNIVWNMTHGFATVRHTASNANWSAQNLFNFDKLGEFLGGQIGLLGPVVAGVFIWGLVRGWRRLGPDSQTRADVIMLSFAGPVLAIVTLQSFISRANANWAAVALVGVSILAAAWMYRQHLMRLYWIGIAINLGIMVLLSALVVSPALVQTLNRHNDVKRLRGWNDLANAVMVRAQQGAFDVIVSDDREDMASLLYYARNSAIPIRVFVPATGPNYEFHTSLPLLAMPSGKMLLVSRRADVGDVTSRFATAEKIETIIMPLGGTKTRILNLFALSAPFTPAWVPEKRPP